MVPLRQAGNCRAKHCDALAVGGISRDEANVSSTLRHLFQPGPLPVHLGPSVYLKDGRVGRMRRPLISLIFCLNKKLGTVTHFEKDAAKRGQIESCVES